MCLVDDTPMEDSVATRIQLHRSRAAELRRIAASITDADVRRDLELLAEGYERMAQRVEETRRGTGGT
jgi:hypothetical protein